MTPGQEKETKTGCYKSDRGGASARLASSFLLLYFLPYEKCGRTLAAAWLESWFMSHLTNRYDLCSDLVSCIFLCFPSRNCSIFCLLF